MSHSPFTQLLILTTRSCLPVLAHGPTHEARIRRRPSPFVRARKLDAADVQSINQGRCRYYDQNQHVRAGAPHSLARPSPAGDLKMACWCSVFGHQVGTRSRVGQSHIRRRSGRRRQWGWGRFARASTSPIPFGPLAVVDPHLNNMAELPKTRPSTSPHGRARTSPRCPARRHIQAGARSHSSSIGGRRHEMDVGREFRTAVFGLGYCVTYLPVVGPCRAHWSSRRCRVPFRQNTTILNRHGLAGARPSVNEECTPWFELTSASPVELEIPAALSWTASMLGVRLFEHADGE
ncbi:hypothetical protein LXA43DRAFT_629171 [Ganoderma leucocontextum]|nr:hypothetical protein LXA43DRAFT_629171 [Ganoderma leucocontextum]